MSPDPNRTTGDFLLIQKLRMDLTLAQEQNADLRGALTAAHRWIDGHKVAFRYAAGKRGVLARIEKLLETQKVGRGLEGPASPQPADGNGQRGGTRPAGVGSHQFQACSLSSQWCEYRFVCHHEEAGIPCHLPWPAHFASFAADVQLAQSILASEQDEALRSLREIEGMGK